MTVIGYARVSTTDQNLDVQESALRTAGCDLIRSEKRTGTTTAGREELRTVLDFLRSGDVLMVTRIDRLARSIGDLQDIVRAVKAKGATLKPDKGRHLDEGGRTSVNGLPSPLLVRMHPGATKPFSVADEAALKQRRPTLLVDQISGFGHVRHYPERDLPPIPQRRPSGNGEPGSKAMTEVITALCVFFSISIFLAHAVDAFRAR
jgi:hypothetical protein